MSVALDEPIAIVGMGCRYPGGVRSPEDLWELVVDGEDAIGEFPEDRGWDLERLYDPDPDHPGTSYARHGGFLYDAGEFDAEFFAIVAARGAGDGSAAAAAAGGRVGGARGRRHRSRRRCAGSDTGVFAGVMYRRLRRRVHVARSSRAIRLTGVHGQRGLRSRLAYTFGLEGPAVTVDTACSSSLVAMHLACQALRHGECSLALAGGVTVIAHAEAVRRVQPASAGSSPDGRCKAFGAAPTAPAGRRAPACSCSSGCPMPGAGTSGAGGGARLRGQPGRRVERADGAERPVAGAGDPRRRWRTPGLVAGGRGRGRGAWDRHGAGRSDRGAGAAGDLWAGALRTGRFTSAR